MKKNQPSNFYDLLFKWQKNRNVKQIQCLVLFFSFLCLIPQTTHAQQAETAVLLKEKKAPAIVESSEEEEGTPEAEKEHQRSVWYKGMQKKNANYFKVKRQFDNYFKKHPEENSKPRQRFEDWLKTNVFYLDKKNRVVAPPTVNYNKVQKLAAVPWATVTDTMAGDWHMLGPRNSFQTSYSDKNNRGGYVNCVKIDPTNPNKLFVGFQTGGLWVSNDGGNVWQLTDKNMPDKAYIDIDVCKANSNYVYAISNGGAVIKSTDGGLTWATTSLNSTNYSGKAYDIAVSPTDANIVIARWGTTLYRTTDGGATWSSILTGLKDYSTTNGSGSRSEVLDFHQGNNNVVYHLDRSDNQTYVTLYRSGNSGLTFTNLGNINIPSGSLGSNISPAKLLSASNNPGVVYIAMGTNTGQDAIHLLRLDSTTGAILLTRTNMILENLSSGDIAMDVNNDNIIVHGTYSPNKTNYSTDNGATFQVSTTAVHADLRALSIVDGKVLLGTDGEATYSSDGGITYTNKTTSISNHELWGFGASHKTGLLGAALNHGPLMIREHEGQQGWYNAMGADEQNSDVNPLDDKYLYSRGYNTYHVVRTGPHAMTNGGGQQEIDPGRNGYNTMHFHPNLYYTLITHHGGEKPEGNPNLAVWKNSLIRSDDNGVTVKIIKTFNAEIRREDICMSDPNRIYVVEGVTNQKLWKTTDGGVNNWTDITPSTAVTGTGVRNISDVAVSDVNPNEIWVTYSGVQNTCQVLHSTDGGVTYSNLTTPTLTTWPITKMLFQRGTNGGVYVGSRAGVFYRNNNMSDWQLIGNGLPMTDVRFMFINYFKGKLMIGTSRGAWDHNLYELTAPKAQISASKNKVAWGGTVKFADYSVLHKDAQTAYSWSFPGGSPSTSTLENPVVNYTVPGNHDVTLTVTDQYGSSTQTLTNFINVEDTTSVITGSVNSTADAYVRDAGYANTNYGVQNTLVVKKDVSGYTREAYLKFDLNSLPSTADKVSLQLNVATANTSVGSTKWEVYYVPTDDWTETGITWNNKPAQTTLLATVTAKGSGTAEWDITSQALSELAGDKILSLKIMSAVAGGTTDAGFSSREDTNAGLRPRIITNKINKVPTVSISSPANNAVIAAGSNVTINANATDVDGTVSKVEFYQGNTLLGESTATPYSFIWNNPAAGSYVLTAKVTDNYGVTTPSLDVNVLVNALPTVSITSPANNAVFAPGSNVTINANAADSDGTITKVEFFQGSTLLGESTTAPYSFTWNNPAGGTYALTAKATDNDNRVTTSSVVTVRVNAAPTVSITSPADNSVIAGGSNVTINANAADTDGTITKVEFYQGSTLLGQSTTAPYSFTWNNPGGGTYTLTAKATDNLGGVATSTPVSVSITVTQPPLTTTPVADAFVRDGSYARTNYGTQTILDVKNDGSPYFRQSYLRFNYSTFTGSVAGNVKLRVYVSAVNTDPSRVVSVYGISNTTWVENKINWNNQPSETGTLLGSYTINNVSGVWYELDVTSYINNQLALGNKIVSFRLVNQGALSTTNNVSFNSREASANKPQLVLTYGSSSGRMKTDIGTKTDVDDPISFNVIASPNPSTSEFKVQVESSSHEAVQIRVYNANQQLIKQLKASVGETITFGSNLPAGMYLIEVEQGLERKVVKVIKL